MEFSSRVVFIAVALLTVPIASKGQDLCELPNEENVISAYITVLTNTASEGGKDLVLNVTQMHFTCLARMSRDMYSEATVVIEFTTNEDPIPQIEQFELHCFPGSVWGADPIGIFDPNVPSMPFNIDTQNQCSRCLGSSSSPDYDADTNCLPCDADCLALGGGFCTGTGDCCPFFNKETGACENDCTTIHPNFGPDENFVCVCNLGCDPGHTLNSTACSCELTDVCEAYGQPCQNGGTCVGDPSTLPYRCNCAAGYSGMNCSIETGSLESVLITANPDFSEVQLGQGLILTCTVNGMGLTEITWTPPQTAKTSNKVTTNLTTGISTLEISAVISDDLGYYSCQAVAGARSDVHGVDVTAKIVLKNSILMPQEELPPLYSGTQVVLRCTTLVPTIVASDDSITVNISAQRHEPNISNDPRVTIGDVIKWDLGNNNTEYFSLITVSPVVQSYDVGQWICFINASSTNPFVIPASETLVFTLSNNESDPPAILLSAPNASVYPSVVRVPESYDEEIIFTCTGTVPKTLVVNKTIKWFAQGEEITDGVNVTADLRGTSSNSQLRVTSPGSVGIYRYTCRVMVAVEGDPLQEAQFTAQVIVTDAMTKTVRITAEPNIPLPLEEELNLTCTVTEAGLDEILWTESRANEPNNEVFKDISAGVANLIIPSVRSSDLGHYSCKAIAGTVISIDVFTVTAKIVLERTNFIPRSLPPLYSGTKQGFQCELVLPEINDINVDHTFSLVYERDGVSVHDDPRITIGTVTNLDPNNPYMYMQTVTISPLVQSYDVGQWTCTITTSSAHPFVVPATFSSDLVIDTNADLGIPLLLSTPNVLVNPGILEVTQFSDEVLTFTCTGEVASMLVVNMSVTWLANGTEVTGEDVETGDCRGPTATSELSITAPGDAGDYIYTCRVTVNVTGDPPQTNEASALLRVTPTAAVVKECIIHSPLTVVPNRTPGTAATPSYSFHGTCEHVMSKPCEGEAYKVVGDFLQSDLDTGRVGLQLPGFTAIIDEELSLLFEGEKPSEVTVEESANRAAITLFNGLDVVVSIVRTADKITVMSAVGTGELCGLCGSKDGNLISSEGMEVTDFMNRMQIDTFASSWLVEPSEQILREDRRECAVIRSDTVIGDPLLQAPLWIQDREKITSLCYEVHGRPDAYFNLVSDECIVVNARYTQVQDLNVVSEIGIRAVGKDGAGCISVKVEQQGADCITTLFGTDAGNIKMSPGNESNQNGVQVRQQNRYRVRISVPNCEQVDLVMWATCEINDNMPMMRFNISRGVNLRSTSHGLLGQFWNIPVTATKVTDPHLLSLLPQQIYNHNKIYMVTVQPTSSPKRTFLAELFGFHWDHYRSPCMYAGNSQGGPSGEVYEFSHSVIEGRYTDYIVSGIFEQDFPYDKFESGRCSELE